MDEWTQERYGPLTEADLWAERHPGVPMPRELRESEERARRRRERLADRLLEEVMNRGVHAAA